MARSGAANQSCVQDTAARAARLLGLDQTADKAAVRRAFREVLRRERPDLGRMSPERLTRLLAARDALLAVAPAPVRPAAGRGPGSAAGPSPAPPSRPSGPDARRFDVTVTPLTGRLVDLYA